MMKVRKPTQEEIESTKNWGTWSKEPSEFPWHYNEKETCYILSGQAVVVDPKGNEIRFGEGDWVEFEAGLSCTWKISKAIHKMYLFG
jgi:uncharacterized protein